MPLFQLIYKSNLTGRDETLLEPIHASALRHNQRNGITGMLLYSEGAFLQVLEGVREDVLVTYHRICNDPRHEKVQLLVEEALPERHFPNWLMGFRHLSQQDAIEFPEYAPYFRDGFGGTEIRAKPGIALRMLQAFNRSATT